MIPLYQPTVPYIKDPFAWERYYEDREKRRKLYKKMYAVDANEYTYVYGLIKEGTIVYIGISKTPYKRYKHHLKHKFNNDWNVSVAMLGKGSKEEMLLVERKLISSHKPVLNIKHVNQ